jgi:DUF1009 family protein
MTLALIAGRGLLPAAVARAQAAPPLVCVLEGFDPENLAADLTFRLEHLGSLLADLAARGVTQVCFCGAITRPRIDPSAIDAATLPLVPLMMQAMQAGDDAALRAIIGLFEQRGFTVLAAHALAPDLLAPAGVLTEQQPDAQMTKDVVRAEQVLQALAPLDVGQGCVVGSGQVWGVETIGGTDHMLATLPQGAQAARAVLVKAPKAGQEERADLPAVGPETIERLQAAGLAGLAIAAGKTLLLEREETLRRANAAGLVIWAR